MKTQLQKIQEVLEEANLELSIMPADTSTLSVKREGEKALVITTDGVDRLSLIFDKDDNLSTLCIPGAGKGDECKWEWFNIKANPLYLTTSEQDEYEENLEQEEE